MTEVINPIPTSPQTYANGLIGSRKIILIAGGSRSGKTFWLCYAIVKRALYTKSRHAILRFHFNDVKRSVGMDTLKNLLEFMHVPYELNKSDWVFTFKNGSEIWLGGLDDKNRVEKILGNEYSTIYLNEASQISYHAYTTAITRLAENSGLNNKIFIDCNPPEKSHWLYKMFILHKIPDTDIDLQKPELYGSMQMNPIDNPHLPKDYISDVLETLPDRQKRRFLYGEWLDKRQGALWTSDLIEKNRTSSTPQYMTRIIVGIDPAVTSKENSDETGIVVVGMDGSGHYYVLEDKSGKYVPYEWARISVELYKKYQADAIVAETNQGGDMVESTIRGIDFNISYRGVRATRGKVLRAEPIEALYEQGRVHHVGYFPELELQMTEWTPQDVDSPDRVDALVWCITDLLNTGIIYGVQPNNPTSSIRSASHFNYGGTLTRPPTFGNGFNR